MKRVGIIGASGYTGAELLRLCAQHPDFEVVYATGDSQAGTPASSLYPSLAARYPDLVFAELDPAMAEGLDVVFLGLPHEASMALAPQLHTKVGCLVDLSAAFRLKDASLYPTWYGFTHDQPELLASAVFGLPEMHREDLKEATLIATPGCHVTAATLALAPLVEAGVVEPSGVIVDSITGVSGAGRALKHTSMFCTVDEDVNAYGLLDHRHTPEIEQETGAQVLFTPHLAPLSRGLLATCYARPAGTVSTTSLLATLAGRYSGEPFVVVRSRLTVDEGDDGQQRCPHHGALRRTHQHGHRHMRDRQPRQGGLGRRDTGGQRRHWAARDNRAVCSRHVSMTATAAGTAAADRAATLVEALPYIRRFADQVVVVKYGGNALAGASDDDALQLFAQDIVLMRQVGMRPVVVHGGGPQINDLMSRLGKQSEFREGLRVTDGETIDIVRMVLIGQVNPQLVAAINVHGPLAVGVSGEDAGLIRAVARNAALGFVGDVESINPTILKALLDDGFIPVVATIGTTADGQAYNINADTVAGAIAEALGAEKLVYLTDIEGLRRVIDDPRSLIRQTTPDELDALTADGTIAGGMIPKVESCTRAVRHGVRRAHILDGRIAHVLLLEIFTDEGIGTMVQ